MKGDELPPEFAFYFRPPQAKKWNLVSTHPTFDEARQASHDLKRSGDHWVTRLTDDPSKADGTLSRKDALEQTRRLPGM